MELSIPTQVLGNDLATTVIMISREGMGHADVSLQHKLLRTFLTLLLESSQFPRAICFYTEGVKLVVEDSPILDLLQSFQDHGVPLIVCQTCLNHYRLTDRLKVGLVGGMGDVIAAATSAAKIMSI